MAHIATIESITSDLTLSTRKEDAILAGGILNKVIEEHHNYEIEKIITKAQIGYNRKILGLSRKELNWLENHGTAVVGIADDYLPFDYYYQGGSTEVLQVFYLTKYLQLLALILKWNTDHLHLCTTKL